ncbi:pirin family protein [Bacillus solimangrovi]|uniref:Pirin n=1 Tax=Bacillus solimangrovi TaxID=1305675 RepID=A0A1E5LEH2_9BACI|nr:pirin family protein [Bacillus solimangrovi]OEH92456.1 pirin [Bacillus solimangrovi]
MIQVQRAKERYAANHGWLKARFSFSFAEYYDPNYMEFGPMRVLNDDIIQPMRGFGTHPHKEMEIVTVVLDGYLKHEDSTGETATTTFGGIQRMTAGTGVMHSEVNPSPDQQVNLLQMWFFPDEQGLQPSYENTNFNIEAMKNNLLPVVRKGSDRDDVAKIHQDLTIYLSDLEEEEQLTFSQDEGRKIFVFVIEGSITLNDATNLDRRDSARITDTANLTIEATEDARFMLIDLPK